MYLIISTNVDINNRIVCFDIKELGKQLKKIGMLDCAGPGMEPSDDQPFRS